MGLCSSGLTEEQRAAIQESNALDKVLNHNMQEESKVIKLLLLGTGESGKSTIFKQMQILYQKGFTDFEKTTFKHVVRRNVVESMQTLLHGLAKFQLPLSRQGGQAAAFINGLDPLSAHFWVDEIVHNIVLLWNSNEKAVEEAYRLRSHMQLIDSAGYLFDNIRRIGAKDYMPSSDDILRARLRTSGIVERTIPINGVDFKFLDVGGQRNERRKWIHCFDSVTAIIYVAAISEYDQVLYEDEKENRLVESIRVWEQVCNNRYFFQTAMILFLNKIDIFEQKIKTVSLRSCFHDFLGNDNKDEATEFIKQKFLEQNTQRRLIFTHVTCATDTQNVQRVFEACRLVILQENLKRLGLS